MKIVFTPGSTGAPVTLADSSASPMIAGMIEQLGGQSLLQTEKRYGQATEVDFPRGNAGGQFVFTAGCTYPDYNTTIGALAAAWALLNLQGTVVVTWIPGNNTVTMPNAVLHNVQRVLLNGRRLELRYTFKITSLSSP